MGEYKTTISIPITVFFTKYHAEGDGHNEPHIPAHIDIEDADLDSIFILAEYILKNFGKDLKREIEENL